MKLELTIDLDLTKIWTVEYSKSQYAYHIDSLDGILSHNLEQFKTGEPDDYQLLAVCESRDAADAIVERLQAYKKEQAALPVASTE